jgi:hypothetical protein
MGNVINIACSEGNINSPCLCCVKVKDKLLMVLSELKVMVDIMEIVKKIKCNYALG